MPPWRLTLPYVGLKPVTRHRVEGETTLPSVSVPIAKATSPAAVAAADPALDPLEPCAGLNGFFVRPLNQTSPRARAPILNLAQRIAPAASSRWTTVAS